MPTEIKKEPYRIYYFSNNPSKDHVVYFDREDLSAGFSLTPIKLVWNCGFGGEELEKLEAFVSLNKKEFLRNSNA